MNYQEAHQYLNEKPETREDFPFGKDVSVMKIKGKMFATLAQPKDGEPATMNLKCDPQEAIMLRDVFESVIPGYHMNKQHWNTVILDGTVPSGEIERMVDMSYGLVVKGLKVSLRKALETSHGQDAIYGALPTHENA
ncbi:putative protein YjbR [BD1-7 clade bacterium]|uniref:MmcQ-like protein n=1 Tax=BD1-7 clade bacterium TaxID=2029982 RepID=A0A5S9QR05_9GAMM|nr:putative protein YjbR [BD1-7 clade bacterium]CAA0121340.1 putative protein YjbR [BD1-7 clade bacterium]CAA0124317.1 putative protein YjbR [BD1-7 clade bacterium]